MKHRIVKTTAIVLKRMDYGETSRIVTLYSREEGRVSVLAKGARSRSNRFGSALEPAAVSHVVYYYRPTRELQTLTQADTSERFTRLLESMESISGALHVLDIVNAITQPGDVHPELYDASMAALRALDARNEPIALALLHFRVRAAKVSGVAPSVSRCISCGRDISSDAGAVSFDIRRGGMLCRQCDPQGVSGHPSWRNEQGETFSLTQTGRMTLARLLQDDPEENGQEPISESTWNELDAFMRLYERQHMYHGRRLRSESLLQTLIR